ncbi:MAG: hypothetical protein WAT91_16520 [Saprospiraceae bacterium]
MKKSFLLLFLTSFYFHVNAQDIWDLVPEFPKGCYSDQDSFIWKVNEAQEFLSVEYYRRAEINEAFLSGIPDSDSYKYTLKYLSTHPVSPEEFAQDQLSSISKGNKLMQEDISLDKELLSLISNYQNVLKSLDLIRINMRIIKQAGQSDTSGLTQYNTLRLLYNRGYEDLFKEYFVSEDAVFHKWLKKNKFHVMEEMNYFEQSEILQKEIYDLTDYQPAESYRLISDYLDQCRSIFAQRKFSPAK